MKQGAAKSVRKWRESTPPYVGGATNKAGSKRYMLGQKEATMGFEPMMRVLQTLALPLGHVAVKTKLISLRYQL